MNYFIRNCTIVNEGETYVADVLIENGLIKHIFRDEGFDKFVSAVTVEALGRYLIPGVIDEHVHFREPGLTHKGDIFTESRAAVAGGVTSFMEMPNTVPQTTTQELLRQKFELAAEKSIANYSFYMGATNDNLDEVLKTDPASVCGIKVFMGSSTGNMLVNDDGVLARIFKESPCLVAAHCEDEDVIRQNTELYKELVAQGKVTPDATLHPLIRTAEACYRSSAKAVEIADKTGGRLHVMHVSTQRELDLFRNDIPLAEKKITAETCPHYLLFDEQRYRDLGFRQECGGCCRTDMRLAGKETRHHRFRPRTARARGEVWERLFQNSVGHALGAAHLARHARAAPPRTHLVRGDCAADVPQPCHDLRHQRPRIHPRRLPRRPGDARP